MDEKKAQESLMMYQMLQGQLEQLRQQATLLQTKFTELEASRLALEEVQGMKGQKEILIPLGNGMYMTGTPVKGDLFVELGGGIIGKKTIGSALKIIEEKKGEIEKSSLKLQDHMMDIVGKINHIGSELEKLMAKK